MSEIGIVGWIDLTVKHAETVRDFYAHVVGWTPAPVAMGDYDDYIMNAPGSGDPIAGVCHARGPNSELPPVWLPYFSVIDLDQSVTRCKALGGDVLAAARPFGPDTMFCVIRDPAGAVAALFQRVGTTND